MPVIDFLQQSARKPNGSLDRWSFGPKMSRNLRFCLGAAQPTGRKRSDQIGRRIWIFFTEVIGQSRVRERLTAGWAHALVFWGFLAFMVSTVDLLWRLAVEGEGFLHGPLGAVPPVVDRFLVQTKLNPRQLESVQLSTMRHFHVTQGPPGAGKSRVAANTALAFSLLYPDPLDKVLCTATTNEAADQLTEVIVQTLALHGRKEQVVRLYPRGMVNNLQGKFRDISVYGQALLSDPDLKDTHAQYMANRLTPKKLQGFLRKWYSRAEELMKNEAKIIVTTSYSACNGLLTNSRGYNIRCLLVDEASMAMYPESLIALTHLAPDHCSMFGDHRQLRPLVLSRGETEVDYDCSKLGTSLFDFMCQARFDRTVLNIQYRMPIEVAHFPFTTFYKSSQERDITTAPVHERLHKPLHLPWSGGLPIAFFNVPGRETRTHHNINISNDYEASMVTDIAIELHSVMHVPCSDICVITPYNAQRKLIRTSLMYWGLDIKVSTIDSFQGRQAPVILLSLVRTDKGQMGHIMDTRRYNVGLTRAQRALCIFGSKNALYAAGQFLRKHVTHAKADGFMIDVE